MSYSADSTICFGVVLTGEQYTAWDEYPYTESSKWPVDVILSGSDCEHDFILCVDESVITASWDSPSEVAINTTSLSDNERYFSTLDEAYEKVFGTKLDREQAKWLLSTSYL